MKQKQRYRRRTKGGGLLADWPSQSAALRVLADKMTYAGSAEHKGRPVHESYAFESALRTDASRCDPAISLPEAQAALREAVCRGCVSEEFDGRFPRYVWGWLRGGPHVARLDNRESGAYKAWPILVEELPLDRDGRLALPQGGQDA
jgi:hypothetical protein